MKYFVLLSAVILMFIVSFSCSSPSGPNNALSLQLSDVACTEAWLNVTGQTGSEVILNRNGKEIRKVTLTSSPQTIYDDSLLPNSAYTYQAIINNKTSSKITAKTLDTTSSDFTLQTFTFGGNAGSCTFYDCAIVNDTLAYAVGEVYLNDSTGQPDPNAYNLAKWNGHSWQLLRVQFYTFCGQQHTGSYPANAVTVLNDTTIWIASNNSEIAEWNGTKQKGIMCLPVSVSKMWAANEKEVYTIGSIGQIGHYTNGSWQKIESGTTLNFYDLWGNADNKTAQSEILAVGSDVGTANGRVIIKINNQSVSHISTQGIIGNITTTWFIQNHAYYIGSGGLYYKHRLTDPSWRTLTGLTQYAITSICGNDINDVFFTSSGSDIVHFNGVSFKSYYDEIRLPQIVYGSIKSNGSILIAVGFLNTRAVITIGKK